MQLQASPLANPIANALTHSAGTIIHACQVSPGPLTVYGYARAVQSLNLVIDGGSLPSKAPRDYTAPPVIHVGYPRSLPDIEQGREHSTTHVVCFPFTPNLTFTCNRSNGHSIRYRLASNGIQVASLQEFLAFDRAKARANIAV